MHNFIRFRTHQQLFSLIGTNARGCTGIWLPNVLSQATPTVIITATLFPVPENHSLLMASGAPSYNWRWFIIAFHCSESGSFNDIYRYRHQRRHVPGTATHVVSVLPGPVVTAVAAVDDSVPVNWWNLVASGAVSWYMVTGSNLVHLFRRSPTASSLYTVTGKQRWTMWYGFCLCFMSPALESEQSVSETEFYVYPNPGKGGV